MPNPQTIAANRSLLGGVDTGPALPVTAGLALWLRADRGLYQTSTLTTPAVADSDPVGGWKDQSGNGNHALQATAAFRPTLKLAVRNGRNVVRFDGVDDEIVAAGASVVQPDTSFVVTKVTSQGTTEFCYYGNTGPAQTIYYNVALTQLILLANDSGVGINGTAAGIGAWAIFSGVFNGASSGLWQNGASTAAGDAGSNGMTGMRIGVSLLGDIAEVLLYSGGLTTANRRAVEAYLAAKYSVVVV